MGIEENQKMRYIPTFLGWCKSYEQERQEMSELIAGKPSDLALLLREYETLTGEVYNEKLHEYEITNQEKEAGAISKSERIFRSYRV